MAATQLEPSRPQAQEAPEASAAEAGEAIAAAPNSPGGLNAWLPLIVSVVTMPLLAFGTTRFVLLPKMQRSLNQTVAAVPGKTEAEAPAAASGENGKTAAGVKIKQMVPMTKLLVNVAGTMGTRYLMTSITLVGNTPDFKDKIEDNKDQLMDLATGALMTKTISDLEKPGARNLIRSELLTVLNNALGGPVVQEIYITEMAIQ